MRRGRRPYRPFPHTADFGVLVRGRTLKDLFGNAAAALLDLGGDRAAVRPRRRVGIEVEGSGLEDLLVRFLAEILFLEESRGWRFRECGVRDLDRRRLALRGVARGERFDPARHPPQREVKAVTYHALRLVRRNRWWSARIVFDV